MFLLKNVGTMLAGGTIQKPNRNTNTCVNDLRLLTLKQMLHKCF